MEKLNILQYNMHKNLYVVMALILADKQVTMFLFLAVQEPFQYSFIPTTHCPPYSAFHLLYPSVLNSRVCFFINKSINPSSWTGDFPSPDYGFLHLRSRVNGARDGVILNIYRPIGSKSAIASLSDRLPVPSDAKDVLSLLHFSLQDTSVDHIVLGDFNLHHPSWGGQHVRPDSESKHLISMYNAHSLRLLLPLGTIIREENNHKTTIDLIFASPSMKNALELCRVRNDLYQGSDHFPIQSVFSFTPFLCNFEPHLLWKQADKQAIAQRSQELSHFSRSFRSISDIDSRVEGLVSWIKNVTKQNDPLSKPAPFCVPW